MGFVLVCLAGLCLGQGNFILGMILLSMAMVFW
jgi:uncharacterized membrane protein